VERWRPDAHLVPHLSPGAYVHAAAIPLSTTPPLPLPPPQVYNTPSDYEALASAVVAVAERQQRDKRGSAAGGAGGTGK